MKFGFRKPSIKKSIKARTTGKIKRKMKKAFMICYAYFFNKKMKKAFNPFYGKKGMGYIRNPKKAIYNKIYNKTTIDPLKPVKRITNQNLTSNKRELSIIKITLAFFTCGFSLFFTGIHKNKK
jgi:hypothetical protein